MSGNTDVETISACTFGTLVAESWMVVLGRNLRWLVRLVFKRCVLEDLHTRLLTDGRWNELQYKCSGASVCCHFHSAMRITTRALRHLWPVQLNIS